MQTLTDTGDNLVKGISTRYGLSYDAVVHMLIAVNHGGGSMAQFNCPELGGSGQWMRGGMTMVGDMFNNGLKNTVDNLCNELANLLSANQVFPVIPAGTPGSAQWWPTDLGSPFSSGAQNNIRYAVFPNRLAVELNGQITIYDTLDHQISGVSQQQGSETSLTFNSQWGNISVNSLPLISQPTDTIIQPEQQNFAQATQAPIEQPVNNPASDQQAQQTQQIEPQKAVNNIINTQGNVLPFSVAETLEIIEKLAHLKELGALSESEFNTKKTELLQRI